MNAEPIGSGRYCRRVTFLNVGSIGVKPGARDELIRILTRPNRDMADIGCLMYEVGVIEDEPDTVHVVEVWESAEAHAVSLQLESVRSAIAEAMPLLSGEMGGVRFESAGSPIRHDTDGT